MTALNTISIENLWLRVGTPDCPVLVDARTEDDFCADPRLIPSAIRRPGLEAAEWSEAFADLDVIVYCDRGLKISQGAAAWLRHAGARAQCLEGGFRSWRDDGLPLVPENRLPLRDARGRTVWVTGDAPNIDRIACSWLIHRFVDPVAVFLFVEPSEVAAVAERFDATAFGVEGAFWSRRDDRCTFDTMIEEFGIGTGPMLRLASVVRGANTERLDPAPQSAGLLAASIGLCRMVADDQNRIEGGKLLFDAFYRWARGGSAARAET